ncbi:uncharacterized protein LOC119602483 [Lucilia sericata]|uniref:uncharacterized protein LOC119602483 n=1 Tax=Lucilia sericata TaxID=13632 RepID=UPI0018A8570F|nr:uncharacterized protein LOC119602483 [Lucilia sericata]
MCSVNERIEKLKRNTQDLRKEVKDLKETILKQNEFIISLLSKQTGMLEENIETERNLSQLHYGKKVSQFAKRFPLESIDDLKKFELEIDEENKGNIINTIQSLLSPQGIMKNVVNILSDNIIMESNMDGHHNKTRLLNFPKTMDVLFLASRKDDNYSSKMFLDDLRRSLRVVKNRYHKNNCRARQKQLLREEQARDEQQDSTEESFMERTEEIYFD